MRNIRHPRGVILYAVLGGVMIQVGMDELLMGNVLGGIISAILAGAMILTAVHRMREHLRQGPVEWGRLSPLRMLRAREETDRWT